MFDGLKKTNSYQHLWPNQNLASSLFSVEDEIGRKGNGGS
jgi:hypothetical protein